MSSEQDQQPSAHSTLSDLKPVRFAGARTLGLGTLPPVHYSLISEKIRSTASQQFNCSVFCDGKKCKYEDPSFWSTDDMAIHGLYSCWVTDDIVTMARPSTALIEKYKIIKQFKEKGIRSIINLQQRGEHRHCGGSLEESTFSYDPQIFMENKIFYYNFDWKDYGCVSKTQMLDIVKVLSFALTEGKVAIHSHSGLGRPGVLVACYLVYSRRCKPNDAVEYLRQKRSELIKTKSQLRSVQAFAQFVVPMFIVYANVIPGHRNYSATLNQYLRRQRFLLHGFEARLLKYIPKPVFMFCERLLSLVDDQRFVTGTEGLELQPEHMVSDPNRFLGFFSAGCSINLQIPSKFCKKQWSVILPDAKINSKPTTIMVNGIDEQRFCAPPSPVSGIGNGDQDHPAFPESPDSSCSPDGSATKRSSSHHTMGTLFHPPEADFLDYDLSEDEENGNNPELELSTSTHPNSVPLESLRMSSKSRRNDLNKKEHVIVQNGGIGLSESLLNRNENYSKEDVSTIAPSGRKNDNDNFDDSNEKIENTKNGDEARNEVAADNDDEEEDPLDDMNSEECNAIIDSVLQDSASEEDIANSGRRKSIRNQKKTKRNVEFGAIQEVKVSPNGEGSDDKESSPGVLSSADITDALLADHYAMGEEFDKRLRKYQRAINHRSSTWQKIIKEKDPIIIAALLWSWLDLLKEPVLNISDLSCIVIRADKPLDILQLLDFGTRYTTEYLVRFVAQLRPRSATLRDDLLRRLVASLTHQSLGIRGTLRPVGKEWQKMRQGTVREVLLFVQMLYDMAVAQEMPAKDSLGL